MGKKEKMTTSARDGVSYRRAKTWQIALSQMTGAAQMCFYALMTYATYIGNQNYGILVGVTGIIITASRILDSVTDPICAYIIERFNSKYGKIRIFLMLGWAIMAAATTLMCNLGAGHLDGAGGLLFFIVCYVIYIIGYTLVSIGGALPGNVMTNDPSQRPLLSVWNTIYSYLVPMFTMLFGMLVLLPKHDNIIGTGFLAEYNIFIVVMSLLFYILVCIGVTPYDKKENFEGISTEKEKTGFSDMWRLIRDNKELQYYMVSACSDKLAQTIRLRFCGQHAALWNHGWEPVNRKYDPEHRNAPVHHLCHCGGAHRCQTWEPEDHAPVDMGVSRPECPVCGIPAVHGHDTDCDSNDSQGDFLPVHVRERRV